MMEIQEIEEILQQKQNPHRYRHTIGVRYTSICLAMRYGEDLTKASYAGLLHDCAKHMSGEKLLEKCRSHHLPVSDMEAKNRSCFTGESGHGWPGTDTVSRIRRSSAPLNGILPVSRI